MRKIYKYYPYIIAVTIFVLWIGALFFIDYKSKEQYKQKEKYIQELEEKVEYYETELKRLYSEQDLDYESQSIY